MTRQRTLRRQQERARGPAFLTEPKQRGRSIALALLLATVTLALYSPVRGHDFVNYDDDEYVLNNEHVTAGLNWQTVQWSFTSTEQANWHPVTWLSHALDCQLFGLDPGSHHLTSVVIHILNVLLLFFLLQRVTGAVGASFVVAALFAWHPFNVESVAWIAERKNLLCTLFFLSTVAVYGWYSRQPGIQRYLFVAGFFSLALASKPMAVTLPLVLLLLDYWPLQRVSGWTEISSQVPVPQKSRRFLLFEKLPLLALAAASSAITVWAQKTGGTVQSLQRYPLGARLGNALYSYVIYIQKTLWPSAFALLYPHPGASLPLWKPIAAVLLLSAIGFAVWKQRTTRPWFVVGWLWFLGTLVPVIGIVQVGDQAMADRYAYLPLIGLLVILVWGIRELLDRRQVGSAWRWGLTLVSLTMLLFLTSRQIGYWQNSLAIWSHTIEVTGENVHSEKELANAMIRQGDNEQALAHLLKLAELAPDDVWAHANIGATYAAQHRISEANKEFENVVRLTDHGNLDPVDQRFRSTALLNLGFGYVVFKDYQRALITFHAANQCDPALVDHAIENFQQSLAAAPREGDYVRLSFLLRAKGEDAKAMSILHQSIRTNPEYASVRELLNTFDESAR